MKDVSKLGVCCAPTCINFKDQDFVMMKLGAASGLWHFWIYGVEPKEQKSNFNFEIRMCELSGISFVDGYFIFIFFFLPPKSIFNCKEIS